MIETCSEKETAGDVAMSNIYPNVPVGWEYVRLDDVAERATGHTPDKNVPSYWNGGIKWVSLADSNKLDRPLISETNKEISVEGIRKSSARLLPGGTVILLRDAGVGRSSILATDMAVSQHFVAWICGEGISNKFLYHYLQLRKSFFERMAVGSTIVTIGMGLFRKLEVPLPPKAEQDRIAAVLDLWDRAIDFTGRLLAEKQLRRKGLMQQLLTGKSRLPGFRKNKEIKRTRWGNYPADWGYPRIGEVAKHVSVTNRGGDSLPVLSCTKYQGLVDSLEYFGRQIFSKDLSTYKVVRRGQFAYATNHIEEGSIGYQDLHDLALISPMYTVFEAGKHIDDRFLYLLLKTELYRHIFEVNTSASVDRRGSLRWPEFSRLHVPLPAIEEQRTIVKVVNIADRELDLLQAKVDALREQKKGLMQQLLTGKMRVKL